MSLAGWAEIFFIALLAFVIIGPKDLPKVLFVLGRFAKSLRRLSDEFKAEFEAIHHLGELEEGRRNNPNMIKINKGEKNDKTTNF